MNEFAERLSQPGVPTVKIEGEEKSPAVLDDRTGIETPLGDVARAWRRIKGDRSRLRFQRITDDVGSCELPAMTPITDGVVASEMPAWTDAAGSIRKVGIEPCRHHLQGAEP